MSPVIDLKLDGDNAWPDLSDKPSEILHLREPVIGMVVLDGGMASGKPSIAFRFDLPEGSSDGATVLIAETSWAALAAAVRGIAARYGWPE